MAGTRTAATTSSVNLKNVYIKRGKTIGSGGFSKVYEIEIYPIDQSRMSDLLSSTKSEELLAESEKKIGALKYVVPSPNSGLESLMEIYIMRHINHPTINRALGVQIDRLGNISIIQNLSLGDAAALVRKSLHRLHPEDLRRWLWQIACGVAQLHKYGILHGDIKAGNVLLFYDSETSPRVPAVSKAKYCDEFKDVNCRLNDFSLTRLISSDEVGTRDMPRHITYTSTHRPMEVWKGLNYSFSADIWALGCTFYELAYHMLLFPDQNGVHKALEAEANYRAFEDWSLACITPVHGGSAVMHTAPGLPIKSPMSAYPPIPGLVVPDSGIEAPEYIPAPMFPYTDVPKSKPIPIPTRVPGRIGVPPDCYVARSAPSPMIPLCIHKSYNLSPEWQNSENSLLNDLLLGMLNIDASHRLSIWEVLDHEYFTPMRTSHSFSSLAPSFDERSYTLVNYPHDTVHQSLIEEAKKFISNKEVIQVAISLYQRSRESAFDIPQPTMKTCVVVANKLLYRAPPPSFGTIGGTFLPEEINLCLKLNYKLLPHSNVRTDT